MIFQGLFNLHMQVGSSWFIHCIESSTFPTSIQICETNATFYPFSKSHGCSIDCNDTPSTLDRWKAFQGKLKLLKIIDEVGLV